jgi:ABC-type lipoprotein release transport system permease subunit
MFARSSGAMRRSFLGFLVADLSVFLGLCAIAFREPRLRLVCVSAAILLPWLTFAILHGALARMAAVEWRLHLRRSLSSLVAVALGTAALTVSLAARSDSDAAGEASAAAFGGPVDLVVETPDETLQALSRTTIDEVRSRPDLQTLFDEEPLELRWAMAWVDVGSTRRVRIVALDPQRARLFGGDPKGSGFETAKPGTGFTLSTDLAASLDVDGTGSVKVLTTSSPVEVPVLQVLPTKGLLGLPAATGRPVPTLFVDSATFGELQEAGWNEPVRYWSLISLCGSLSAAEQEGSGVEQPRCAADSYGSRVLVQRVEQELNIAFANVALEQSLRPVADSGETEVLFTSQESLDQPVDEARRSPIRVHPVKLMMLEHHLGTWARWRWEERVLVGLLASGAALLTMAACFVDRRKRTARERMLGLSANMIHGMWTGVILLSAIPGVIFGAAIGTFFAGVLGRLTFARQSIWPATFRPLALFVKSLSWALVCCSLMGLVVSILTQRIPLVLALRGAPLMTAQRWVRPGAVLVVVGIGIGLWSRLRDWRAPVAVLFAGTGLCVLTWSFARSKLLVAVSGGVMSLAGLAVLRRGWILEQSATTAVALVVLGSFVVMSGLVGSYVSTAPGQYMARFGVPRVDAPALSVLRTRSATRPGPWPLLPLIGATLVLAATTTAASVVLASNRDRVPAGQSDSVVLKEFQSGTVSSVVKSVSSVANGTVAVSRSTELAITPLFSGNQSDDHHRRVVTVASFPNDLIQRIALVGQSAASSMALLDADGVIVVADSFRTVNGRVPEVGNAVTVQGASGIDRVLTVRAVVDRVATPGGLLVNDELATSLFANEDTNEVLVLFAAEGMSAQQVKAEVGSALLGRNVETVQVFSAVRPLTDNQMFLRQLLRAVLLLDVCTAGVLVWRWADERRRLLVSSRPAAIGPAFLARSINQDATAHVGSASALGSIAGVALGWVLRQSGGQFQVPWLVLLAVVVVPTLLASVVARFPTGSH